MVGVCGFNSPVGIRWIGTRDAAGRDDVDAGVSIPQSEFDGLGPGPPGTTPEKPHAGFQFPSRNSMDWDGKAPTCASLRFRSFNSPVGIRWIGTQSSRIARSRQHTCFNSPVGIRWIGTSGYSVQNLLCTLVSIPQSEFDGLGPPRAAFHPTAEHLFQFPSRNSMDWDATEVPDNRGEQISFNSPVGIRWIGTRNRSSDKVEKSEVSIPQSEFDGLGRHPPISFAVVQVRFNSPVGIRWIGTPEHTLDPGHRINSFNSPVGIRWIGTPTPPCRRAAAHPSFNSPVGIRWIGTASGQVCVSLR